MDFHWRGIDITQSKSSCMVTRGLELGSWVPFVEYADAAQWLSSGVFLPLWEVEDRMGRTYPAPCVIKNLISQHRNGKIQGHLNHAHTHPSYV